MKGSYVFTDKYIIDYFARHPEKDNVTLNELFEDANSLYGSLLEEIGLKPFEPIPYGSLCGYVNPNKSVEIIF